MNFTRAISRQLALPALAFLVLVAAGVVLIWSAQRTLARDNGQLAVARAERQQAQERLVRIAEEEREVRENIEVYRRLKELGVIGEERRLEWVDAMARIRAQRGLLDLRYQVERQKLLKSVPGKPANVDVRSSTMNVELALLHEADLLRFLDDVRASGNAHYSVRRCSINRIGQAAPGATIAPRLRANCQIDLITLLEGTGKT